MSDLLNKANLALSKAKIGLMTAKDTAFFSTVCFSLQHLWDLTVQTACTNGLCIKYNPEFFLKLNKEEQLFLILHETMHCAQLHALRLQTRDAQRWNMACDHNINLTLVERGFTMPKGGLADKRYKGLCAEEIYNLLPASEDYSNYPMDLEGSSTLSEEELQEAMQDILVQAAIQSQIAADSVGTIPGDIQLFLDKLLKPKLPWHRILQKYLQSFSKSDYSFRKANRRFFPTHYLPSLYSESPLNITIAVDISGSVTDHEFNTFIAEIAKIITLKPEKITLIQFDTAIQHINTITSLKDLSKIIFTGRGGTDIAPIMDYVNTHKPALTLVFTDGEFKQKGLITKQPLLWIINNNPRFASAIGKIIHYTI